MRWPRVCCHFMERGVSEHSGPPSLHGAIRNTDPSRGRGDDQKKRELVMGITNGRNWSRLEEQLEMMRFLNKGTERSFYLYDPAAGRVYFADRFDQKYNLQPMEEGYYPIDRFLGFFDIRTEPHAFARELPVRVQKLCYDSLWLQLPEREPLQLLNELRVVYSEDGNPEWVIGTLTDASLRPNTDAMTGLADEDQLLADLRSWKSRTDFGCLMILGIDNFRDVNIRHGRDYGDDLLSTLARLQEKAAEGVGRVYRLEGDQFAIHLQNRGREDARELYERIRASCAKACTFSVGTAEYTCQRQLDTNELFQHAETALSIAKRQGKNMMVFYTEEDFDQQRHMLELQDELRESVDNGCSGFFLTYQPQIHSDSCSLFGAEALLRFRSPTRGLVRPDVFMEILERTGLIIQVGEWVLKTALEQCRRWREWNPDMHISVNVSYIQLRERNAADRFLALVRESGVPGSALTLEFTESMQLQDFQYYNKVFYKLEHYGIQIAIDDFGTGYSSLSYLKRMAVQEVKIDRCFVTNIQYSAYNRRLLENMIELSRSAGIRVCCEGVETEQELAVLRGMDPDLLQGYLFSKPCEPEQFEARYIRRGSEEYDQCRRQEDYFRDHCGINDLEEEGQQEQERLSALVDSMEELVYVRALDSHELLYMNAAGRQQTGMYDYKGCKCYRVMENRDTPCENCDNCNLKADSYRVREMHNDYLDRHYLFKEKLMSWQGKPACLAVAIDVTDREVVTKRVREKLEFEQSIVECTRMLLKEKDVREAVEKMLQSICRVYDAQGAFVFELVEGEQCLEKTYQWLPQGTEPPVVSLDRISVFAARSWMEQFLRGESVMVRDVQELKATEPALWRTLSGLELNNLIIAPLWKDMQVMGILGLANPKAHTQDPSQVETIAYLLADRRVNDRTRDRLKELLDLHYEDILGTTRLGLWVIRLSKDGSRAEMFVDRTMRSVLGIREPLTPEECYNHWYNRINEGYFHYVNYAVDHMIKSGNVVELCYTWNHPVKGETTVRCLGIRVEDMDGMICLEGYHRETNQVDMPDFLPDERSIIFEYNENKHSVYFHNSRKLLWGDRNKEEDFPEGWIRSGMVHPHFVRRFREIFTGIREKAQVEGEEFLLKADDGSYAWFKLKTRQLSSDEADADTIIVLLDPANQERAMELEYIRQKNFYQATLSEKIAYGEIDLETRRFLCLGGLWKDYADRDTLHSTSYRELLLRHAQLLVHPEDLEKFRAFIQMEALPGEEENSTRKMQMRRLIGGQMRWVELTIHLFRNQLSENSYALLYMRNIDAEKRRELETVRAASRDPLTHVYNRSAFQNEVRRHLQGPEGENSGTLLMLDMDDFKHINDRFGHVEGDRVLRTVSDILLTTFRRKDIIGRFGGDEFTVFMKNVTDRELIQKRFGELREALRKVPEHNITCSAGGVEVTGEERSYELLLRRADIALYRSKEQGKNLLCFFREPEQEVDQ